MAEDSPSDAELARLAFGGGRILTELTIVPDGEEALAYLRHQGKYKDAQRPDLLLLDLNMPKKDGRQVLKEVKEDLNLRTIPVVILTTSEDEQDIERSYQLQASAFVTKPVVFDQFVEAARTIEQFYFHVVTLPQNNE